MEILVLRADQALEYAPSVPTYALRIINSPKMRTLFPSGLLVQSPNYKQIKEYAFDDCDPLYNPEPKNTIMFNEKIAEQILCDFREGKDGCASLLIHCGLGLNRSPAVAIALNEIFRLGNDTEKMKRDYPLYTVYIYNVLRKMAEN